MSYPKEDIVRHVGNEMIGKTIELLAVYDGVSVPICDCNVVGNTLETIFFRQANAHALELREGPRQASPDFYGEDGFEFEQKTFLAGKPGFDISNFCSYVEQLCQEGGVEKKVFKTIYLLFEYSMQENIVTIKNFHYLHVWALPSYSGTHPISMQVKRGMWYNIRPDRVNQWVNTTKTPTLFIEKMIECINKCDQVAEKDSIIANISSQFELLRTKYTF